MGYIKQIRSTIIPNTELRVGDNYSSFSNDIMVVMGKEHKIENNADRKYLLCAINLINSLGIPKISKLGYDFLKSQEGQSLLKLCHVFYPVEFNREIFEGSRWGYMEGSARKLALNLEARWPWSISTFYKNNKAYKVKELVLKSEMVREFMCSVESNIITPDGSKVSLDKLTIDHIEYLMAIIVASYIKEMRFFGSLEGRIFNGGNDVDEFVRKGYLIIK